MASTPTVRLFLLSFAGGNLNSYRPLAEHFPPSIEHVPLELPGRGARMNEDLLHDMTALAEDQFHRIAPYVEEPYALFGHSMGACLAYLVVRRIVRDSLPLPLHLVASGSRAPAQLAARPERKHLLPSEEFLDAVSRLGGVPREIIDNEELLRFLEPIIRADYTAIETYSHRAEPKLDVDMTVLIGSDDDVTYADALMWQAETTRKIRVRQFLGDHFYLFDHAEALVRLFAEVL